MRWINVNDRLPTGKKNVLTINNLGGIDIMDFNGSDWVGHDLRTLAENNAVSRFPPIRITHWMPLPNGPKSEAAPSEIPEQQEQATIILRTALNRLRAMGYAVETRDLDDNLVWIHELNPVWRGKVLEPLE